MTSDQLEPKLDLLLEEYVLVQAWKKTASFIRYHNWYSDTLALDRAAVNLPRFLDDLRSQISDPGLWKSDPLRIIPAPKSHPWRVDPSTKRWAPVRHKKSARTSSRTKVTLRPLAHVSLKDQVAATAVMLCLANRVESIQGDPRKSINSKTRRQRVISYGNRLYCDSQNPNVDDLKHRWGSGKLYRAFSEDYRHFLARPEIVAEFAAQSGKSRVLIVHSDLRQFYDRVRPGLLADKLSALKLSDDDPRFFSFAKQLLNWEWVKHTKDRIDVDRFAKQAEISGFVNVALPQGLVAAGFFANVTLLDFDKALRDSFSHEVVEGLCLVDACRYVDDLRLVLTDDRKRDLTEIEKTLSLWLQGLIDRSANGLIISDDKTAATVFRGDERPLVRQSRKMERIQRALSGGFDAVGGEEVLDAVYGLIRSQQRYSDQRTTEQGWAFAPIADVRDATVARFAAARFRTAYRSLRPLLAERGEESGVHTVNLEDSKESVSRVVRTQADLDEETRAFALRLVEDWVEDPSNVRLLRIGLDLWPAGDVLTEILNLLKPYTKSDGGRGDARRVAWYCLSELFRAGATETGFTLNDESLPKGIDIAAYRKILYEEAIRLLDISSQSLPWYLKQQVLLFLAVYDTTNAPILKTGTNPETKYHRELIRFLKGDGNKLKGADFATLAVLARRAFRSQVFACKLVLRALTATRLEQIAERDPSFALEIVEASDDVAAQVSPRVRDDLGITSDEENSEWRSLARMVLDSSRRNGELGFLRHETELLVFAAKFLEGYSDELSPGVITPSDIHLTLKSEGGRVGIEALKILVSRVSPENSIYRPPAWSIEKERWRFQLGYVLRFILTANADFTNIARPSSSYGFPSPYRSPSSHCYQRMYGLYNGHSAFGDDWLPISDWIEHLLSALLSWPGCREGDLLETIRSGLSKTLNLIRSRIEKLNRLQGPASSVYLLPNLAPSPEYLTVSRPIRACVVQTVIPNNFDRQDLSCSSRSTRRRHRNHLSAALAAVERMLDLRETHEGRKGAGREGRLDWLILPELSVHPDDIRTHLVPFARAHRAIVLAGLTYQELFPGEPLVNSAIWVIPTRTATNGLQVTIRRQGKWNLAPEEDTTQLQQFRPCQWIIGYEWSANANARPLWLSASVCYDATDLRLVTDLREKSDIFAIPALNKDVGTFDQMALALHYHMFQMVIVANNGQYGGSNAYVPYKKSFKKQVFHLHGQPQASIAFLEIDSISSFISRVDTAKAEARRDSPSVDKKWKSPPAGL